MATFFCYLRCSTCRKANSWLQENGIEHTFRDIVKENPTASELKELIEASGLPISKFFNTSGIKYRELKMKDKVKTLSVDELIEILASDGMLVKRPLFVSGDKVLVGFKEEEWKSLL